VAATTGAAKVFFKASVSNHISKAAEA